MRAIIFANGTLNHPADTLKALQPDDLIIAADGGAHHCRALNLRPDMVIGDFDSLTEEEVKALQERGVKTSRHPTRKDETDLELALIYAAGLGVDQVLVFGAIGSRWDMSLANVLLLAHKKLSELRVSLVDGPHEILLIRAGENLRIQGQHGDTVSLIPVTGEARGINTQGLEYPLSEGTLRFGSSRGISNVLLDEEASISLENGLLLCVVYHGKLN
jgi:thiamine pyrophosphokinase